MPTKFPANPHEAERRLAELARQLKTHVDQNEPHPYQTVVSVDLLNWFIEAVHSHAENKSSLDQALGLVRKGNGRPSIKKQANDEKERDRRLELALRVHPLVPAKPKRPSWKLIARLVNYSGKPNDLRKLYNEHFDENLYISRTLSQRLSASDK